MINLNNELKDYVEHAIANINLGEHAFFRSLLNGELKKEAFIETQKDFSFMVQYFNRPMALVAANIPNPLTRQAIIGNLWEEHGNGDPSKIHGKTILTLIERLGGKAPDVVNDAIPTNAELFNISLQGISAHEDYRVSASVFGGIERTFADVSELICQAITRHGWLEKENIIHYGLHKEIDVQHAEDFFKVVETDWEKDQQSKEMIKRGVNLGINLFTNVYSDFARNYC